MTTTVRSQDGVDIAYRVIGDGGTPLLLLHSLALDGTWYLPLVERLGPDFTCVIPDLRGHGASGGSADRITLADFADDAVAVLDELGVERAVVVGVSLGGMAAQAVAARHPERCTAAVLIATTGAFTAEADAGNLARSVEAASEGGLERLAAPTMVRWFGEPGDRDPALAPLAERGLRQFLEGDPRIHAATLRAMPAVGGFDVPPSVPALVIAAEDDASVPFPAGVALAESIPGARFERVTGGHLAPFTAPEPVAELIRGFVHDVDLRRWIDAAETPALLMTVAHLTGDPAVLRDEWRPVTESLPASGLSAEADAEIRAFALAALTPLAAARADWPAQPGADLLTTIGEWVLGPVGAENTTLIEAAYVPPGIDARAPGWTMQELAPERRMRAVVVGAGLSGLLVALRLKQAGIDFTVYEKDTGVGGVWYENTYPDCRIDVHSHIYTYSFFPRDWPSYFCRQEVIRDYLSEFADVYGLREHIAFRTEVTSAAWSDDNREWTVDTVDGDGVERSEQVDIVISAVGQLNRPSIPAIPGLDSFAGPAFHTSRWDHDVDLAGKRVALIGTGASGVQVGPAIAREAGSLTVFQRTAPFLQPTPELRRDLPADEREVLRELPLYAAYHRLSIFLPRVIGNLATAQVDYDYPPTERSVNAASEEMRVRLTDYLLAQVPDRPDLAEKIVPDYPPGAKRLIRDDGTWLSTLKRDDVELVTAGVERIDETGVWTTDGVHVEADVIVFGTGFKASDYLMPMKITGRGGRDLHEMWGVNACAYYGMTVPGFPNMFCMYGPNTGLLLHGNVAFFIECASVYMLSAIRSLVESGKRGMDLRTDVYADYRDEVYEASRHLVWSWSKTHSWYQNAEGHSTIMWPLSAHRYVAGTHAVDPENYEYI